MARCPRCAGSGADPDPEPDCCGNLNAAGECRGDCVVPVQVACKACGGSGELGEEQPDLGL